MDPIIKIENLSKQYRLGNVGTGTLSHDLNRWWAKVQGKEDPFLKIGEINTQNKKGESDYVWALKDINLEVMPGEVLGIIGKNGAGKSTLLKLLSRVTAPTMGSIKARGRIASLLEVGTGFHPELTGRENIFLNGAILGMTKAEIRSKFDEIVYFAGVERYIDTPVKRYSSGMYVRLAFAVAAHLESEILVVDEVLAVGDAEFQEKAMGKMKNISQGQGRTVLFVSHNMSAIQALCQTCVLLKKGEINTYDETGIVIERYLKESSKYKDFRRDMQKTQESTIIFGQIQETLHESFIEIIIESKVNLKVSLDLRLTDRIGTPIGFGSLGALDNTQLIFLKRGCNEIKFRVDTSKLALGEYIVSLDLTIPNKSYIDRINGCLTFEVIRKPATKDQIILKQNWGYGSYELDLKML